MLRTIFCFALLGCTTAAAQITIPDTVERDRPMVAGCDCIIPEGSEVSFSWGLEKSSPDSVAEFIQVSDSTIHIWAGPGTFKLTTDIVWVQFEEFEITLDDGTKKKIRSLLDWGHSKYQRSFTVKGSIAPDPDPEPGPEPGPDPDPVNVPSDEWDLGKTIYTEAMKIPAAPRAKAKELADNFDAISGRIAAGGFGDGGKPAAMKELADVNKVTLGGDKGAWDPALTELNRTMIERRVPTTLKATADAFTYIARGLRAVN